MLDDKIDLINSTLLFENQVKSAYEKQQTFLLIKDKQGDSIKQEPKLSNFVVSPVNHYQALKPRRADKKVVFLQKSNGSTTANYMQYGPQQFPDQSNTALLSPCASFPNLNNFSFYLSLACGE